MDFLDLNFTCSYFIRMTSFLKHLDYSYYLSSIMMVID